MLLAAGRAAFEVRAQAGYRRVRVRSCDLELDVAVELGEALVAAQLRPAGPSRRARASSSRGVPSSSPPESVERQAGRNQMLPELPSRVVQGLVERATAASEALGEDVDGNPVQGERHEHAALVGRQRGGDSVLDGGEQLVRSASSSGVETSSAKRDQVSGSSGISRPCQARRRSFTAASRSANLYAQVVKRLAPRKSSSRARTETSASSAACRAMSSKSSPRRCGSAGRRRATSKRAARRRSA